MGRERDTATFFKGSIVEYLEANGYLYKWSFLEVVQGFCTEWISVEKVSTGFWRERRIDTIPPCIKYSLKLSLILLAVCFCLWQFGLLENYKCYI